MSVSNTHTYQQTHTLLTVKAPVETVERSLQRSASLSDQSLSLSGAQTGQVLLHGAGTAGRTLRTHPQMFTWCIGENRTQNIHSLNCILSN